MCRPSARMVPDVHRCEQSGPLLGRDAEIELLDSLLDGNQGGGTALVLYGEPGIGKSRLLAAAAAFARERGGICGPPRLENL
jgi:predicted ATP-dependent serine protease